MYGRAGGRHSCPFVVGCHLSLPNIETAHQRSSEADGAKEREAKPRKQPTQKAS